MFAEMPQAETEEILWYYLIFFSFLLLAKLLFNLHILSALYYSCNIIIMHASLCTWNLCDVVCTGFLVCKGLTGLLYIRKKETL